MDWLNSLFMVHSSIQTVVVVSAIIALGLALGKIKVMGISLGIAFVFFVGILAGNLGLSVDTSTLDYIETFGLSMFVYCLGLHVGPNFFGSLRHEGMGLNLWGLAVILAGTLLSIALIPVTGISLPDMVGLLCGATTNTPALGAATQTLQHLGLSSGSVALATAVTYPLGVVGVILAMVILRKLFVKPCDLEKHALSDDDHTFIEQLRVVNPAILGKTIAEIRQMTHVQFIISRIWRGKETVVPQGDTVLHVNDQLLVVTNREDAPAMTVLFGEKMERDWMREQIDWNAIDADVESRVVVVTRPQLNGRRLGYTNKIYNRSSAMLESIKSAILKNVQGVVSVAPYENCTNEVDSAGRWPHSIEVVVEGGDATEIAQQILNTKAGGINTFGSVETTLHGVYGEDIVVRFNRPTYVKVWFKVGVTLVRTQIRLPTMSSLSKSRFWRK